MHQMLFKAVTDDFPKVNQLATPSATFMLNHVKNWLARVREKKRKLRIGEKELQRIAVTHNIESIGQ